MKLTKEQLAAQLNGRQYGDEITKDEERDAKESGLVVIFGYSDDNMEIRGVIHDEIGAGDDSTFRIGKSGILEPWDDRHEEKTKEDARKWFAMEKECIATIRARFGCEGYSWIYETTIPHATFEILEDGESENSQYCRGIVFAVADLPKIQ